jgi:hypothetical protein
MKNLTAIVLLGLLCCPFVTKSQDEKIYAKQITPAETPEAIKDALKKDFPDAIKDIHYYMVPDKMVNSEWGVAMSESVNAGDKEYYTVEMKGKGGGFVYGLYNKNGELEVMKMEAKDFKLPDAIVKHATSGDYQGYKIQSQKYSCYKVVDKRTNTEYVQVETKKGNDTKVLYYTPKGDFIREKK